MKKTLSILLLLILFCVITVTLTACGNKTEKTTLERFAQDWYAYTMTTITDGVESPEYGEFEGILYEGNIVYNDFVRFYLSADETSDGYQGWYQHRIANPNYEQGVNKQFLINFSGLNFTWNIDGETATFHIQGNADFRSDLTSINSDFTATLSGDELIVEQLITDNIVNRYYCKVR